MTLPKTGDLPLSEERRNQFKFEANEVFAQYCIGRDILKPSPPEAVADFRKIGINRIVDRIWFVEGTFGDRYYARPSGAEYGIAVAEGEAELVLKELFEHATHQNIIEIPGDPEEDESEKVLSEMHGRGFQPSLILTNLDQVFRFWEFKNFRPGGLRRGLRSPEGYFHDVPVCHSRLLPSGLTLVLDQEALGRLEVKTDFTVSVDDVRQLTPSELEAVMKVLANKEAIGEKARILSYEVVRATIFERQPSAFLAMKTRNTPLAVRVPANA
jgi:hypothetical protein